MTKLGACGVWAEAVCATINKSRIGVSPINKSWLRETGGPVRPSGENCSVKQMWKFDSEQDGSVQRSRVSVWTRKEYCVLNLARWIGSGGTQFCEETVSVACHLVVLCEGVGLVHRATFCEVSSDIVVDVFSNTITEKKILIGWNCWGAG